MSVRLEWTEAEFAGPTRRERGEYLEDGGLVTAPVAVVIGTQVIEGTYEGVVGVLRAALELFVGPDGLDPLDQDRQTG